ncbi:MAG: hypothetical protein WB988_18140 [Candidatus Nitrosopolaris sp.]
MIINSAKSATLFVIVMTNQMCWYISIIRTRKAKTANWLFARYSSIMQPQNRNPIEKIAALLSISQILERIKSKVS